MAAGCFNSRSCQDLAWASFSGKVVDAIANVSNYLAFVKSLRLGIQAVSCWMRRWIWISTRRRRLANFSGCFSLSVSLLPFFNK